MTVGSVTAKQALVIVFRVDASIEIGTGHVMRCLTLADELRQRGAECHFVCREHPGNLNDFISKRGYPVYALHATRMQESSYASKIPHAHWLQTTWDVDAAQSYDVIREHEIHADWLIVDHYAIDAQWQKAMRPMYDRLMVIDDLADREHIADLLLDQNLDKTLFAYEKLAPESCMRLIGPEYALLRPEFAQLRSYSLNRRKCPTLNHILITMGGIDKDNVTGAVLEVLNDMDLPAELHISVVMGAGAPRLEEVRKQVMRTASNTALYVNVKDMAQQMADADLVIGAAGSTAWERCALGVPTLMFSLAENQMAIAKALECQGAAIYINQFDLRNMLAKILSRFLASPAALLGLINSASRVTDGCGTHRVVEHLMSKKAVLC